MMRCVMVLSCLLLCLPACIQKSGRLEVVPVRPVNPESPQEAIPCREKNQIAYSSSDVALKAATLESKFCDIPIPLGVVPIAEFIMAYQSQQDGIMLGYLSQSSSQSLYEFFMHECVRQGWKPVASLRHVETLLCFEKPDCHLSISIRPCDEYTNAIIICIATIT